MTILGCNKKMTIIIQNNIRFQVFTFQNKFVIFNYVSTALTIIIQYKRLETGATREP
jgi:hypothetical protein